ncbi:unnamed protein product, partial [marine sediment metagenome]
ENIQSKKLKLSPTCSIPDEYEQYINILLNYMYNSRKTYYNDIDIMKLVSLYDYIGWFDVVCLLIDTFYVQKTFEKFIEVIEYITDKENILINLKYKKIFTVFVGKCINEDRFDLIDTVDIKYIDLDDIETEDDIKYIKLLEYLYKINGDEILLRVDIDRLDDQSVKYKRMNTDTEKYILNMSKISPIKNYLLLQYMVCNNNNNNIILSTIEKIVNCT